ncbi:MAG: glutamate 5-kinase [Pseudomonadota bacterium]
MSSFSRDSLSSVRRIVVKVGSALLSDPDAGLDRQMIEQLAAQLAGLMAADKEVVLVSSGAVAEGCARLGWKQRPTRVHQLQAAAAVGQMGLVQAYESALGEFRRATAMIMLTHDDLADRQRYLNARGTLNQLLEQGVVPVINENDTVATEEIRFGDNDTLAALVANLLEADILVILTDVEGLLDADPRHQPDARRIPQAAAMDSDLDALPSADAGVLGRGGMVTKLRAARLASRSGAHTLIADGRAEDVLMRLLGGEDLGTLLTAELSPLTARKRWIAGQLRAKGDVVVDSGAAAALTMQGVSLLAVGVSAVRGEFQRGDVVRICTQNNRALAQGLSNYDSATLRRLAGVRTEDFAQILDMPGEPEVVHRDNLVLV